MLSIASWRRNKAFYKLAIQQNLEYRFNFFLDCAAQPIVAALIEITLWYAIFRGAGFATLAGYDLNSYLAYAFWAAFVGRISTNWMYEYRMIAEIESGSINSLLTRPVSFFEAYLGQLLGYKSIVLLGSLWVPIVFCKFMGLPFHFERLPGFLLTIILYLFLVHLISFIVATLSFHLTRVGSFTMAKNLGLWLLSGELFPLDLLPEPYRSWVIRLPFSNAVYIPVGYITGRVDFITWAQGLLSLAVGLLFFGLLACFAWRKGIATYVGTGA